MVVQTHYELNPLCAVGQFDLFETLKAAARDRQLLAEWSRPVFADERPVYARLPTFAFGPRRGQTAVTLNRSQRSSTCRALSFSLRSLRSPLRSKMA
jgi:hypothetical protein